jgi:hypothetical protein
MRCPYCGSRLGKEPEAFCGYCGEKLPPMQGAVLEKRSMNRNTGSRSQKMALQKQKEERREIRPGEKKPRRESTLGAVLIVLLALALFAGCIWVRFGDGMDTAAPYLKEAVDLLKNVR